MQTISLSETTATHLQNAARLRGLNPDDYADELLSISLAVLRDQESVAPRKRFNALELVGTVPTGRTASEIEADLEGQRNEWGQE